MVRTRTPLTRVRCGHGPNTGHNSYYQLANILRLQYHGFTVLDLGADVVETLHATSLRRGPQTGEDKAPEQPQ